MKNLFLKDNIDSLASDVDFALNNQHKRAYLLANFERMKPEIPFSERFNSFLLEWYEQRKEIFVFVNEDDFDPKDIKGTLNRYVEHFRSTGKIQVWSGGGCENTIFGDPYYNLIGRCFHEFHHVNFKLGYDFASESIVASLQASVLPTEFIFEKELILIDILGQAQYYSLHREFLKNQRLFVVEYMIDPINAIFKKQNMK